MTKVMACMQTSQSRLWRSPEPGRWQHWILQCSIFLSHPTVDPRAYFFSFKNLPNLPKASQQCAPPVLDDVSLVLLPKATATKYVVECYYTDPYISLLKLFDNIKTIYLDTCSNEWVQMASPHSIHSWPNYLFLNWTVRSPDKCLDTSQQGQLTDLTNEQKNFWWFAKAPVFWPGNVFWNSYLRTFVLILSVYPYCACKFACHVIHQVHTK